MTRFLLSLDQAVDTIFAALARRAPPVRPTSRGCPSARMIDVAEALIGDRRDRDRHHRHPARREDPRDPGLRGGGPPHGRRAATTTSSCRSCPSCRPDATRAVLGARVQLGRQPDDASRSVARAARAPRPDRGDRLLRSTMETCCDEGHDRPRHAAGDHPAEPRSSRSSTGCASTCWCTPARTSTRRSASSSSTSSAARARPPPRRSRERPSASRSAQILERVRARAARRAAGPAADPRRHQQRPRRRWSAKRHRHPRLPHGGRQPLLRRPGAGGGQPAGHRPLAATC